MARRLWTISGRKSLSGHAASQMASQPASLPAATQAASQREICPLQLAGQPSWPEAPALRDMVLPSLADAHGAIGAHLSLLLLLLLPLERMSTSRSRTRSRGIGREQRQGQGQGL
jgi:hypothetical protein